jgi:alkylation response protein AidB-like acyl-CoA dehydrogenase
VIPEEYGGAGLDFVAEALSCEEIERGEAAFRTLISVHVGLNSLSLLRYGSEEQKQRYLVPQARGEKLACFGLTEPAAGSDVASMLTTARREGDSYVLNGQKNWISYASVADHQLVFAKTDPAAKHKGISAFVVERGWKGVTTQDTENKLGIWAGSTASSSSRTSRCPPRTSSARRARASRSPCTASTRAASPSPRARWASSAPASSAPSSTRASARPSASRSARTSSCRT